MTMPQAGDGDREVEGAFTKSKDGERLVMSWRQEQDSNNNVDLATGMAYLRWQAAEELGTKHTCDCVEQPVIVMPSLQPCRSC